MKIKIKRESFVRLFSFVLFVFGGGGRGEAMGFSLSSQRFHGVFASFSSIKFSLIFYIPCQSSLSFYHLCSLLNLLLTEREGRTGEYWQYGPSAAYKNDRGPIFLSKARAC